MKGLQGSFLGPSIVANSVRDEETVTLFDLFSSNRDQTGENKVNLREIRGKQKKELCRMILQARRLC